MNTADFILEVLGSSHVTADQLLALVNAESIAYKQPVMSKARLFQTLRELCKSGRVELTAGDDNYPSAVRYRIPLPPRYARAQARRDDRARSQGVCRRAQQTQGQVMPRNPIYTAVYDQTLEWCIERNEDTIIGQNMTAHEARVAVDALNKSVSIDTPIKIHKKAE